MCETSWSFFLVFPYPSSFLRPVASSGVHRIPERELDFGPRALVVYPSVLLQLVLHFLQQLGLEGLRIRILTFFYPLFRRFCAIPHPSCSSSLQHGLSPSVYYLYLRTPPPP
jgi:hypothetical protein